MDTLNTFTTAAISLSLLLVCTNSIYSCNCNTNLGCYELTMYACPFRNPPSEAQPWSAHSASSKKGLVSFLSLQLSNIPAVAAMQWPDDIRWTKELSNAGGGKKCLEQFGSGNGRGCSVLELCAWPQLSGTVDPNRTAQITIQRKKRDCSHSNEAMSTDVFPTLCCLSVTEHYTVFFIWRPLICPLDCSVCAVLTHLSDKVRKRREVRIYRPNPMSYMCHICIYSHYVAIILPFWFQRFYEESTFLVLMYFLFLWLFFSSALFIYTYFLCDGLSCIFQYSVETAPWEMPLKRLNTHINSCSKANN